MLVEKKRKKVRSIFYLGSEGASFGAGESAGALKAIVFFCCYTQDSAKMLKRVQYFLIFNLSSKYVTKSTSKISPHLKRVDTLP